MSISSIISTASTGLSVAQSQISITSTNIANSGTDGYTKKSADVCSTVVGGMATGVQIVGIGNDVDSKLHESVVDATSTAAYDKTVAAYLSTLISAIGSTSDGSEISQTLTAIETALSAAISDPSGTSSLDNVIEAIDDWTNAVNGVTTSIQSTRSSADLSIQESVENVNTLLEEIDDLNSQIVSANADNSSTLDLEDARRTALEDLAQYLDVQTFTTSTGAMQVYTTSGKALLTSTVHTLSYESAGNLSADSTYNSSGTGTIPGILLDGEDITGNLSGGSIGALIELRDVTLPSTQADIDVLAETIAATLNAASNSATTTPPPTSLTSPEAIVATDAFTGSGTMTMLLTDTDGTITGSVDIDLSTCATNQDVIDAIDAVPGMSASLNTDGELEITADDGTSGIIITGDGIAGADSLGVSQFFGFNNLVSGSAGDLSTSSSMSSQGLPMATITSTTVGSAAYVSGDTSGLQAVWTALDSNMSFEAGGNLSATETSASNYTSALIDDLADRSEKANTVSTSSSTVAESLSSSFVNSTGVNVDEETALLTTYQQNYEASAQILSTAQEMWSSLISIMN